MLTTTAPGTSSDKTELKPYAYFPEEIPGVWEELEPLIDRAVEESFGMATTEQIRQMLLSGHATAFVTIREGKIEAVLIMTIITYATYKSALVYACAGKGLFEAAKFLDLVGAWAVSQGAVELEAWCRPIMERLVHDLGWRHRQSVMIFDLRRKLQ